MGGIEKFKLLLGLALVGYGLFITFPRLTVDFEATPAVVTQSYKEMRKTSPDRPGRYFYTFEYRYTYQDREFLSDRYSYGGRDTAEAVCNYKPGDRVTAYVNPNDPTYAVIKRGVSGFVLALTGIGVLIIFEATLYFWLQKRRAGESDPLRKAHRWLSTTIGVTIFFGGLGYFVYLLISWALAECVN
ncbi:MAG: hypothetical protein Kow0031_20550 [Anaerolineae bacterium]